MENATLTASQMLARAREAKGLSQKELAEQLFLSTTFIGYIDEGEFYKLPKPAFIKGYLRSYARSVGLDGDVVVAAYERDQNMTPNVPQIGHVTEETVGSGAFTGPVVQSGIIGLVLIVVVAGLVWWLSSNDDKTPPAVAENDASVLSQEPSAQLPKRLDPNELTSAANAKAHQPTGDGSSPDSAAVAPNRVGNSAPETLASASSGAAEPTALDATDAAPTAAGQAADTSAAAGNGQEAPVNAGEQAMPAASDVKIERKRDGNKQFITVRAGSGNDTMAFSFKDDCWVEITDGRGEKIYGDLNRAGDVMTVYGTGPFNVLLGKAPAVTMTWQGKPVDLGRYTEKDQTAKIRTARL